MKKAKWIVNIGHLVNWGTIFGQISAIVASGQPLTWKAIAFPLVQTVLGGLAPSFLGAGHAVAFGAPQTPDA